MAVGELLAMALAGQAGLAVGHVTQAGGTGGNEGIQSFGPGWCG
jgi:hypothetical protein